MEVKNHINNTLATAKRWPRPLNGGGRWIEVLSTAIYWQINRDFGKWPLNGGWPLNRWPLNRGRTVDKNLNKLKFISKNTYQSWSKHSYLLKINVPSILLIYMFFLVKPSLYYNSAFGESESKWVINQFSKGYRKKQKDFSSRCR